MSSVVPPEKKLTSLQLDALAENNSIKKAMLRAFFLVEGAGIGFSDYTGKMLIQFEPLWMKKFLENGDGKPGVWINNGVGNQTVEYEAFEEAKEQNEEAAMKSTSIGIGQVMGFHYGRLGFSSVKEMWDFAEQSELNQAELVIKFIKTDKVLFDAVKSLNMKVTASRYNGAGYLELAEKLNIVPYDQQLLRAYHKFSLEPGNTYVTTTTANIRKGPGTSFALAAKPLFKNSLVKVLDKNGGWDKVEVIKDNTVGWVSDSLLAFNNI